MVPSCADVASRVTDRLRRTAVAVACGDASSWPMAISLGVPSKSELTAHVGDYSRRTAELEAFCEGHGIMLEQETRMAAGVRMHVARRAIVPLEAAYGIDASTARHIDMLSARAGIIRDAFGDADVESVIKKTAGWSDLDFELLVDCAEWFRTHDERGMTPRQVPVAGVDAKWLDVSGHVGALRLLVGRELHMASRPEIVQFKYLDPGHADSGGRVFDSHLAGDASVPAYLPKVVAITENADTFYAFPQLEGGICIWGCGRRAASILCELHWACVAGRVLYWGDIDADGFEILDSVRAVLPGTESVLMDAVAYERYERFGTDNVPKGKIALDRHMRKPLARLLPSERVVYDGITDPGWKRHRRIEQERIPMADAMDAIRAALGTKTHTMS